MGKERPDDKVEMVRLDQASKIVIGEWGIQTQSIAANPTEPRDLNSVASHKWEGIAEIVTCTDCFLTFTLEDMMRGLPPCPGPEYVLVRRSHLERPSEGKHAKQDLPPS